MRHKLNGIGMIFLFSKLLRRKCSESSFSYDPQAPEWRETDACVLDNPRVLTKCTVPSRCVLPYLRVIMFGSLESLLICGTAISQKTRPIYSLQIFGMFKKPAHAPPLALSIQRHTTTTSSSLSSSPSISRFKQANNDHHHHSHLYFPISWIIVPRIPRHSCWCTAEQGLQEDYRNTRWKCTSHSVRL